ncbi:hypothetical protein EVAR_79903_1 [Eumeta japonica]|uniref:Uncharacterized protein n=1 Tax=Eumeta variegata TaxID=151549 RepID=A0A4C1TZ02_EUMVA|nr:hypothetical protein EVAR_79903_1 [Eumeta japonica]
MALSKRVDNSIVVTDNTRTVTFPIRAVNCAIGDMSSDSLSPILDAEWSRGKSGGKPCCGQLPTAQKLTLTEYGREVAASHPVLKREYRRSTPPPSNILFLIKGWQRTDHSSGLASVHG